MKIPKVFLLAFLILFLPVQTWAEMDLFDQLTVVDPDSFLGITWLTTKQEIEKRKLLSGQPPCSKVKEGIEEPCGLSLKYFEACLGFWPESVIVIFHDGRLVSGHYFFKNEKKFLEIMGLFEKWYGKGQRDEGPGFSYTWRTSSSIAGVQQVGFNAAFDVPSQTFIISHIIVDSGYMEFMKKLEEILRLRKSL